MCRFIAYTGHPILLDEILIKPVNSLINQSIHARETRHPLNGDGFGVGWYDHNIDPQPGLFKSVRPAWNNINLIHLSAKIRSSCFFAHVRAASVGGVTNSNSHPFDSDNLMFMHNGGIGDFHLIKRHLRHLLDDDLYDSIFGATDSEHLFALLRQVMRDENLNADSPHDIVAAIRITFKLVNQLQAKFGANTPSFLNIVITNGHAIVATHYVSDPSEQPRTLHYSVGKSFEYKEGICHMHPVIKKPGAVVIASEELNDFKTEWKQVPINHCIIVDAEYNVTLEKLL